MRSLEASPLQNSEQGAKKPSLEYEGAQTYFDAAQDLREFRTLLGTVGEVKDEAGRTYESSRLHKIITDTIGAVANLINNNIYGNSKTNKSSLAVLVNQFKSEFPKFLKEKYKTLSLSYFDEIETKKKSGR